MKEGWEYKKLEECCDVNYGTRVVRSKVSGSEFPVYGGGGETFRINCYNRENCLVVARFAMSKQCTRYVNGKFFLNDSGLTVSPKIDSCLTKELLEKYLLANNDLIYSFGRGSAQRNLNMSEFRSMLISFPIDNDEQRRIVSYLDSSFQLIDEIKEKAQKSLSEAKALFQSALAEAMEPKEGWEEKTLGEIATEMYRGSGIKRDQITPVGIPCLRYGEIYTTYNYSFDECVSHTEEAIISPKKYFEKGDILFAITGESVEDIGKCIAYTGNMKCLLGGDIVAMKHKQYPQFLAYALSTKEAIRQKGLGKVKLKVVHTNIPALKTIRIYLPTIETQKQIVSHLDKLSSNVKQMEEKYQKIVEECDALKQAMLRDVFE